MEKDKNKTADSSSTVQTSEVSTGVMSDQATETTDPATTDNTTTGELTLEDIRNMIAEKFGVTFDNDADLYSFIANKIISLREYMEADEQLNQIIAENPVLYAIIDDMQNGRSFEEALAANVDRDELFPLEGDPDFERIRTAAEARRARLEEADRYRKEREANMEASRTLLKEYFDELGWTDDEINKFTDNIDSAFSKYAAAKIDKDLLEIFRKAEAYDRDIESAREDGAIEGKNARVDAERVRRAQSTDGMPSGGSAVSLSSLDDEDDDIISEVSRNSRRNW